MMASLQNTLRDLIDQIHTELEKRPALTKEEARLKIQRMWRIRRARKQLKALVRNVYASFQDPVTGETYYYNTKTKTTQWTKPKALGGEDLVIAAVKNEKKEENRLLKPKRVFASKEEATSDAALRIQGMLRAHAARKHMRKLISSIYEKIWDAASARFYYHNTHTKQVKWEKPRWVDDADLLTPRTRQQQLQEEQQLQSELKKQSKLEALRGEMTPARAATMLQRTYRRKKGFENLLRLCREVYERIYDPSQHAYYYHNTRTQQTTWEKPALLRNVQADVFTPRTRHKQLEAALLVTAASRTKKREKRDWTEEEAASCLQGLFRTHLAKKALAARLAQVYKKVKDRDSGVFYYVNVHTQEVSWERPALLLKTNLDVDEYQ